MMSRPSPHHITATTILLASLSTAFAGCKSDPEYEVIDWVILAHRKAEYRPRDQPKMMWIRRGLNSSGEEVEYALEPRLAGFQPEWGIEYHLRVKAAPKNRGPFGDVAGVGSIYFDEVVKKTPRAGDAFVMKAMGSDWLSEGNRAFIDGQSFSCEPEAACESLDALAATPENRFEMRMRHGARPGELVLLGVEAVAPSKTTP